MCAQTRRKQELIYDPGDPEIVDEQGSYLDRLWEFNHLKPSQQREKQAYMKETFAQCGENCYIELPFYANWGGKNIHFGDEVYANFNLTIVDDGEVYVGDRVMFGPNVTVGKNSVIGAGSVVTKDIPADVVAVGNPCRVLRSIGEHDKEFFYKEEKIDWENL